MEKLSLPFQFNGSSSHRNPPALKCCSTETKSLKSTSAETSKLYRSFQVSSNQRGRGGRGISRPLYLSALLLRSPPIRAAVLSFTIHLLHNAVAHPDQQRSVSIWEGKMTVTGRDVLLVGRSFQTSRALTDRLSQWGFRCHFAGTMWAAWLLLSL